MNALLTRPTFVATVLLATAFGAGCLGDDRRLETQYDAAVPVDAAQTDAGAADAGAADAAPTACVFHDYWQWDPALDLPSARESFAAVVHGDHLVVVGGWTQAGATATVVVADRTPGPMLGPWQTTTPLPAPREHLTAVVSPNTVYVMGGDDGAAGHGTVYAAAFANGQLGAWSETAPLPQPRVWHASATHGDAVYVIGGMQGFGPAVATIYRGTLDGAGGITGWVEDRALPEAIFGMGAFVAEGHLYVVGGATSMTAAVADVRRAPIAGDGSLGAWESLQPLPDATATPGVIPVGDRMLVIAGLIDFDTPTGNVWSLPLVPGATAWTDQTELPDTKFGHSVVRVRDDAYVLGGWRSWTGQPSEMISSIYTVRVCQ